MHGKVSFALQCRRSAMPSSGLGAPVARHMRPLELPLFLARKAPRTLGNRVLGVNITRQKPSRNKRCSFGPLFSDEPESSDHQTGRSLAHPRTMRSREHLPNQFPASIPNIIDFDSVERSLSASTHSSSKSGR
jgi:hypothetical protein